MPVQTITVQEMLDESFPVADVRSPGEYEHARIPGACSIPLFTNEERAIIGTAYKQKSRQEAITLGLGFFGPRMNEHVSKANQLLKTHKTNTLILHCWRGGMRSEAMAWLFGFYGLEVKLLAGGYKAFRTWVLDTLQQTHSLRVLGGYTGTGKTVLLKALEAAGEPVIDLEALACHRGSAFGHLGMGTQPGAEQFENELALQLYRLHKSHPGKPIWIEDESIRLGNVNLPKSFYNQLVASPLLFLEIPKEQRLNNLMQEYGSFDPADLLQAIFRIRKRLGGLAARESVHYLMNGNLRACFSELLDYYDRFYLHGKLNGRSHQFQLTPPPNLNTVQLSHWLKKSAPTHL